MATSCTLGSMFNKFLSVIIFLSVTACSSGSSDKNIKPLAIDPTMPKKIILFVPGYYGSTLLEEDTKKVRWAKISNFLISQTGAADEISGTNIGSKNKLVAGDVLKNVSVISGLWSVDAYINPMKDLTSYANQNQMSFESVAFDWRCDFVDCLKVIDSKIKNLNLRPEDQLYVVGHSMGGLLLSYYLRYGAQDVESAVENWEGVNSISKVALIAPPLHGLMILFRDIEDGTSLGLNRELLSARDYSTFKSSYFFLPPKGEDIGLKDGEKLSLGIHDIAKWEANKWGPFKFATEEEIPVVREYVKKYMHRSEKFHELLRAKVINKPAKKIHLLQMRGLGTKTLELADLKYKDGRWGYKFNKKDAVDGDGTVTAKSSAPLSYFKEFEFTLIDTKLGHLDVLTKEESQKIIQEFLSK